MKKLTKIEVLRTGASVIRDYYFHDKNNKIFISTVRSSVLKRLIYLAYGDEYFLHHESIDFQTHCFVKAYASDFFEFIDMIVNLVESVNWEIFIEDSKKKKYKYWFETPTKNINYRRYFNG